MANTHIDGAKITVLPNIHKRESVKCGNSILRVRTLGKSLYQSLRNTTFSTISRCGVVCSVSFKSCSWNFGYWSLGWRK